MILTAHQPAYLPWLGFFEKVSKSDTYVLMDSVQFETNSFINRNKICTKNGESWLTIPCLTKNHLDKTIQEIEINNTVNWRKKHWMSLYQNYNKSPYFHVYSDFFEDMYTTDWLRLNDLLEYQLHFFFDVLNIDTKVINLSELSISSKKEQLVLDMCKKLKADKFDGVVSVEFVSSPEVLEKGWDLKVESARLKEILDEALR